MRLRRTITVSSAAAVVLLMGGAVVEAASNGPSKPPSSTPPPKSLTVTAVAGAVAGLAPGRGPQVMTVTVSNPSRDTGPVRIDRITGAVGQPQALGADGRVRTVDGRPVAAVGCTPADFTVSSYDSSRAGATAYVLSAQQTSVRVPLLVQMVDTTKDQDACKRVSVPFTFTATASGK